MPERRTFIPRWFDTIRRAIFGPDTPGVRGERLAARFLQRAGYRIMARNLRTRLGEVDLLVLAPDRRTVVLVEVKTSLPDSTGPEPETRVHAHKQRKLTVLASQLVRTHRLHNHPLRFDVVGVRLPARRGQEPTVRHHVSAFESLV